MNTQIDNHLLVCTSCSDQMHLEYQSMNAGRIYHKGDYVKLRFTDKSFTEVMWAIVTSTRRYKGKYKGRLDNQPFNLTNIKLGDTISFEGKDVRFHVLQ